MRIEMTRNDFLHYANTVETYAQLPPPENYHLLRYLLGDKACIQETHQEMR